MTDFDYDTWKDDYYTDVYNTPKKLGVEIVDDVSLIEGAYEFDILLVLRDLVTGKFYVIRDAGCSCPSPFEYYRDRASLGQPLSAHEAVNEVSAIARRYSDSSYTYSTYKPDVSDLVAKIMAY